MTLITELLSTQLKKAGVDLNNPDVKTFIEHPELSKIEAPEPVKAAFDGLFTVEGGKNNEELSRHFKAIHLNGVDSTLEDVIKGLSDTQKAELKALTLPDGKPDTLKRMRRAMEMVKETEAATYSEKIKNKDKVAEELQQKSIEWANKEIEYAKQLAKKDAEHNNTVTAMLIDNFFSGVEYGNSQEADVNIELSKTLLAKELAAKGAKIKRDGLKLKLLNAKSEETELAYMEGNKEIGFDELAKRMLAEKKMLKVSDPTPPAPKYPQYQPPAPALGQRQVDTSQFDSAIGDLQQNGAYQKV